jgi:hypothetical protein
MMPARRMERLAPGVYVDTDGGLHLVLDELLRAHGWPDTPANRAMLVQAVYERFGEATIHVDQDVVAAGTSESSEN